MKKSMKGRHYVVASAHGSKGLWRGWATSAQDAYDRAADAIAEFAAAINKPTSITVRRTQERLATDELTLSLHPNETPQDLAPHQVDRPQAERDLAERPQGCSHVEIDWGGFDEAAKQAKEIFDRHLDAYRNRAQRQVVLRISWDDGYVEERYDDGTVETRPMTDAERKQMNTRRYWLAQGGILPAPGQGNLNAPIPPEHTYEYKRGF